ncbi:cupin domain-containing protein [Paraburkholderia fungorum]
MTADDYIFVDGSQAAPAPIKPWNPLLVPREAIEREIERLADAPRPEDGRRSTLIVHPLGRDGSLGFAPGVDVTINVLKPGEQTRPILRSSNQLEFCIRGSGVMCVGNKEQAVTRWDVASIPSMQPYFHKNVGDELFVRLTYSNAPLLRKLGVHWIDYADAGAETSATSATQKVNEDINRTTAPDIQISEDGARLRGYEFLTDIQVVENKPLVWSWEKASQTLSFEKGDEKRNIMLLYNPATERRNGTTHSFFATLFSRQKGNPSGPVGRGHKHSSVAINYHFSGSGKSVVDGVVVPWKAGDLLLSGPSWSEHAHYYGDEGALVLTVQDHPLHIGMESLIWQERMDGPILNLGSEAGQKGYIGPRQAG